MAQAKWNQKGLLKMRETEKKIKLDIKWECQLRTRERKIMQRMQEKKTETLEQVEELEKES